LLEQVNPVFTGLWKKRPMLKAFLIALAVLVTVDAGAWEGRYRRAVVQACDSFADRVAGQDWTSGPLL
jgi:hypothetical protein